MGLFLSTSLIAAFIAGIAALLAPCCVTVLLPSYFASVFRTRKKVFLMTFLFFLGVLVVFLPLGLGFSAVGQFFSRYHSIIFTLAGLFMLALGIMLLSGKKFVMPFSLHPKLKAHNAASVFMLGIFSGIATTCCAPVLAGVLALSVLPGSLVWGLVYTLAYVLGMVSPLFILAALLDRSRLTERLMNMAKPVKLRLFGKTCEIGMTELIAGSMFVVVGTATLFWASVSPDSTNSNLQIDINIALTRIQQYLNGFIGGIPQYVWAILILGIFAIIAWIAVRQLNQKESINENQQP